MKFKISRSIRAGKFYYIARSSTGTIRKDSLKELEKAIKDYNKKISAGEIRTVVPEEGEVDEVAGLSTKLVVGGSQVGDELEELGLSSRTVVVLVDAGIKTAEQLKSKSRKELRNINGIGPKSIEEIEGAVGKLSSKKKKKAAPPTPSGKPKPAEKKVETEENEETKTAPETKKKSRRRKRKTAQKREKSPRSKFFGYEIK